MPNWLRSEGSKTDEGLPEDTFADQQKSARLPAKSIPRFVCVSKQLYSFLSSDVFQKTLARHLDHHQNPEKLLVVSGTSPHMFETFDCEAPASGLAPSHFRLPFDAEESWQHMHCFTALVKTTTNLYVCSEKFEVIEAPFVGCYDEYKKHATLMVQKGCHHFCIMINDGRTGLKETCIQLWKMVEDGC
uniref:Uncharacterized protein n=1 Tax=Tanacetum cinerariifolium TaxID=118510 RepID=A0A6L2LE82_TANCI|nr:hypothetical protein [Tanacetum cinerariifolium]